MHSGVYDACDVTLSVYPHRASLKNMPDHGGNRTYDLWNGYTLRVWIYTQSHKHHIHLSALHQHGKYHDCWITLISRELDSVPKYHILEPTRPRSSVGRALG